MARSRAALLLAVILLALVPAAVRAGREAPLPLEARAPDFALHDHEGRPFRLSAALMHRDFVVLAFYVKAFTRG